MLAGAGTSAHSNWPFSRPSARTISSRAISQAISRAVRDFGSGRYVEPSGMRSITFRVAAASLSQYFRKNSFEFIECSLLFPQEICGDLDPNYLHQLLHRVRALLERSLFLIG